MASLTKIETEISQLADEIGYQPATVRTWVYKNNSEMPVFKVLEKTGVNIAERLDVLRALMRSRQTFTQKRYAGKTPTNFKQIHQNKGESINIPRELISAKEKEYFESGGKIKQISINHAELSLELNSMERVSIQDPFEFDYNEREMVMKSLF